MEKLMGELINAVSQLGAPTVWDFAPVLLSAAAVVVAIYVPSRIAKKQNQIAVFDKLYTAYSQFLLVRSFSASFRTYSFASEQHETLRNIDLFCAHFETAFGYRPDLRSYETSQMSIGTVTSVLRKSETQVYMLPLLISKNVEQKEACSKKISAIYEPLLLLTAQAIMPEKNELSEMDKNLKDFVAATDAFYSEYADAIEATLMCKARI